jgi:CheY-like chemotaxis protein
MVSPLEKPAQILVVDDSDADVEVLRVALTQHGERFELTVLADGEAAIRFIADHRAGMREPQPCVIVLDLNLPRHDGLAVIEALKAEPALAHIQVLLMSSFTPPRTKAVILEMGVMYRDKPRDWRGYLELAGDLLAICKEGSVSQSAPPMGPFSDPKGNPSTGRTGSSDLAGLLSLLDFGWRA